MSAQPEHQALFHLHEFLQRELLPMLLQSSSLDEDRYRRECVRLA